MFVKAAIINNNTKSFVNFMHLIKSIKIVYRTSRVFFIVVTGGVEEYQTKITIQPVSRLTKVAQCEPDVCF